VREVTEVWREFVKTIIKAKELWEEFAEIGRGLSSLDYLPEKTQEILSRVSILSSFENGLDAMIGYAATQGGWEVFLPEEEEEPINKEKEKTNARAKSSRQLSK